MKIRSQNSQGTSQINTPNILEISANSSTGDGFTEFQEFVAKEIREGLDVPLRLASR